MKYFVELAYKGTKYHGWQIQPNANTVQAEVNKALKKLLSSVTESIGSGRTDTGVHALGQVFHFESNEPIVPDDLKYKLNCVMPHDISVREIRSVMIGAHARFDATDRTYIYKIHKEKDPFKINQSYLFSNKLDIDSMNEGCQLLMNHTDFESFSKVHTDVNNFNCEISTAVWSENQETIEFRITANRFLRNMVRAIVGTMLEIGTGKITPGELNAIVESKKRSNAGRSVPAEGLYLVKVNYPKEIFVN